jgi:hypothetical protein
MKGLTRTHSIVPGLELRGFGLNWLTNYFPSDVLPGPVILMPTFALYFNIFALFFIRRCRI